MVVVTAGEVANSLAFVAACVPRRPTRPIIGNCLLTTGAGKLTAVTTNFNVLLSADIKIDAETTFAATVPCAPLTRLIAELPPDATVMLKPVANRLRVASGRGTWSFATLPPDQFPHLDAPGPEAVSFTIAHVELRRLMKRVQHAMSTEETRHYLCGAHLKRLGGTVALVATDARRLVEAKGSVDTGPIPAVTIPTATIKLLDGLAGDDVMVSVTAARIAFSTGSRTIVSKVIDSKFPSYEHFIPKESANRITVASDALSAAVKRLVAVASGSATSGFTWNDNNFTVCLVGTPETHEEIEPISLAGTGRVAMQSTYLIELLASLGGELVVIDQGEPSAPVRITRPDEPGTTTLIMPIAWFAS
jgi:DNA polymerase-3 subunit beta